METSTKAVPASKGIFAPGGKLITPEEFAGDLVVDYPWNKVAVGGGPGGGKSRTSAEIEAGIYNLLKARNLLKYDAPLLVIDTEKSAQFLVEFFKSKGVPVKLKQTKSLADVQIAFDLASAGHYFGVYIDSVTHILKNFVDAWMAKNNVQKLEMRHYGQINPAWEKEFGQKMVQAETHVVFTGRGTADYSMVEDEETGKKSMEKTGVKMQVTKDTAFDPNLVIWMTAAQKLGKNDKPIVWREAFVMKDRSGLIDGKTFGGQKTGGPVWKDFAPHFEYLLKNFDPKAQPKKQTSSVDTLISDPQEADPTQKRRLLAIDEIKTTILSFYPSQSATDKQQRANLLTRHFNTASIKVVETMSVSDLETGLRGVKTDIDTLRKAKEAAKNGNGNGNGNGTHAPTPASSASVSVGEGKAVEIE